MEKNKMKKYLLMLLCICFLFVGCNHQNNNPENQQEDFIEDEVSFDSCVYDKTKEQLILSDSRGNYKLSIFLYKTELKQGEYQFEYWEEFSGYIKVLEGVLQKGSSERDVKTTLFINYTDESFKASGPAELYKADGVEKSGETFNFEFNGILQ